jgi:hypothetical protein
MAEPGEFRIDRAKDLRVPLLVVGGKRFYSVAELCAFDRLATAFFT